LASIKSWSLTLAPIVKALAELPEPLQTTYPGTREFPYSETDDIPKEATTSTAQNAGSGGKMNTINIGKSGNISASHSLDSNQLGS
jgi:hypothetical protein